MQTVLANMVDIFNYFGQQVVNIFFYNEDIGFILLMLEILGGRWGMEGGCTNPLSA